MLLVHSVVKISTQADVGQELPLSLHADMLHRMLVQDVEDEIRKEIMPGINERIKKLALESVGHWALKIKAEKSAADFGMAIHIDVAFVENVINKHVIDNEVTIYKQKESKK